MRLSRGRECAEENAFASHPTIRRWVIERNRMLVSARMAGLVPLHAFSRVVALIQRSDACGKLLSVNRLRAEDLRAHAAWLRRLAGALVAESAAADDLVQETWLAALEQRPDPL